MAMLFSQSLLSRPLPSAGHTSASGGCRVNSTEHRIRLSWVQISSSSKLDFRHLFNYSASIPSYEDNHKQLSRSDHDWDGAGLSVDVELVTAHITLLNDSCCFDETILRDPVLYYHRFKYSSCCLLCHRLLAKPINIVLTSPSVF